MTLFRLVTLFILAVFAGSGIALASEKAPLTFKIEPTRQIFTAREGVAVKLVFHANERVKLCLDDDILNQMRFDISRSGVGKIPLQPWVSRDNRELFARQRKVRWLKSGEELTVRANLKRYQFAEGNVWSAGDYSTSATFGLCEQTPGDADNPAAPETSVKSDGPAWFMIMN